MKASLNEHVYIVNGSNIYPAHQNDVVRETMKKSPDAAIETHQEYGVDTYRLSVSHKAYSIKTLDESRFNKLLIMVGNFHLELAVYGVIGTFINESGAEYQMGY